MAERTRDVWQERSKAWAATAPQGRAEDDTFNQMIIAEAGIRPGEDVLDLASGTGNPAVSIALALDGRGSVTCADLTPGMLETARGRAAHLGLALMRFVVADMAALPFAGGTFDCATCRFGLQATDNKAGAAAEAHRVLKPGGRFACLVWGPYEENPAFHVVRRVATAFLGEDEGPPPGRHGLSAPGTLTGLFEAGGFVRCEERPLSYLNPVPDLDAYVANRLRRGYAKQMEDMTEAERDRFAAALKDAWQPYLKDGIVQVPNVARLALGWKE